MPSINKSLVRGSLILLVAFNLYNFLNFIFHFSMARFLSVADYGVLLTLYSIIYLFGVFSESIQIVIVKYSSKENDSGKLKNLLKRSLKKSFFVSIILFLLYLLIAIPLAILLKIEYPLLALTGLMILLFLIVPANRGMLQGKKRFKSLGFNMISEALTKLALAIFFVYIGWRVYGAIIATVLGVLISLLFSFVSLKDIMKSKEKRVDTEDIYEYTKPAFVINLAILLFYSVDVIIARIFFSEFVAGSYAIASILAKTIFMGTQPISRAMFPLSAENHSDNKKSENILLNSFAIILVGVVIALVLFYFFPDFIVHVFSGKEILEAVSILFYLGIAIGLFSFASLILLYKLSVGKIKGYPYLFLLIFFEIVLLCYFSNDLSQFSIAFITSAAVFLGGVVFLVGE